MAASPSELVLLFDVDHTLIDGAALKAGLEARVEAVAGVEGARRFWQAYEAVRADLGFVDLPETIERFGREAGDASLGEALTDAVWGLDFAGCLYPGALDAVAHARGLGLPVIVSDGDERYQRHKIRASGLEAAFEGRVLIFEHKERETETIRARWPARRYVLIDDKPRILAAVKSALGEQVTTVLVEQGPYALESVADGPPPDVRLPSIAAFRGLDAAALSAAGQDGGPPASSGE